MRETHPIVTPYENSALSRAQGQVIEAFKIGDAKYTLKMLRVLYGTTARKDIIAELEPEYNRICRLELVEENQGRSCQLERQMLAVNRMVTLDEKVMQFYFKVTTLLYEKGYTEFMKAKPRYEDEPTI